MIFSSARYDSLLCAALIANIFDWSACRANSNPQNLQSGITAKNNPAIIGEKSTANRNQPNPERLLFDAQIPTAIETGIQKNRISMTGIPSSQLGPRPTSRDRRRGSLGLSLARLSGIER
jgi:hypothetical protein